MFSFYVKLPNYFPKWLYHFALTHKLTLRVCCSTYLLVAIIWCCLCSGVWPFSQVWKVWSNLAIIIYWFQQFSDIFLIFFYVDGHAICKNKEFYFLLFNLDTVYFLFLSHCISRISSIMSKGSVERKPPCLVPNLSRKDFSFSPFNMMLR